MHAAHPTGVVTRGNLGSYRGHCWDLTRSALDFAQPDVYRGTKYLTPQTTTIRKVVGSDRIVTLRDGTVWQIYIVDTIKTALWLPSSRVLVRENRHGPFGHKYLLENVGSIQQVRAGRVRSWMVFQPQQHSTGTIGCGACRALGLSSYAFKWNRPSPRNLSILQKIFGIA